MIANRSRMARGSSAYRVRVERVDCASYARVRSRRGAPSYSSGGFSGPYQYRCNACAYCRPARTRLAGEWRLIRTGCAPGGRVSPHLWIRCKRAPGAPSGTLCGALGCAGGGLKRCNHCPWGPGARCHRRILAPHGINFPNEKPRSASKAQYDRTGIPSSTAAKEFRTSSNG